ELLTTQRLSLDNLRRQLPYERLNLDDLFNRLKGLYRKGHIQIEVRKRCCNTYQSSFHIRKPEADG
ncbi:MAG: hypothetical protein NZ781_11970, partial [Armatimonadetes bacterium]|nr:hypothetical protein [Armatimonadota bacterium]